MGKVIFEKSAFTDFNEWKKKDKKIYKKITNLISDILQTPYNGIGKPEPLKFELKGYWSRRINEIHRLVYTVTDEEVIIVSCRYHYE